MVRVEVSGTDKTDQDRDASSSIPKAYKHAVLPDS
jgi:hypothetical protein